MNQVDGLQRVVGIIVNFRTTSLTIGAAEALLRELEPLEGRLVVIDNDSGDGSFERLSEAARTRQWGERVAVVQAGKNGGFGAGVNAGIRHALRTWSPPGSFYVMNPDAIPDPGAVRVLLDFLDAHPAVGIAGSHVRGSDGESQTAAFRFPTFLSELEGTVNSRHLSRLLAHARVGLPELTESREVDWISGASLMVRKSVLDAVGLFDEGFFLYYEETDLCRRATSAGFRVASVPASRISHIGSVSTGMNDRAVRMPSYWFASRRRYFKKHHGHAYVALCDAFWIIGGSLWRIKRAVRPGRDDSKRHLVRDFVRYNVPRSLGFHSAPDE